MRFVACVKSKVAIGLEKEDQKILWAKCSQAVYDYAKKNLRKGDEVIVDGKQEGRDYVVSRIEKRSGSKQEVSSPVTMEKSVVPPVKSPVKPENMTAQDHKVLTDMNLPVFEYPRGYMSPKTPEESRQIRSLAIVSSTADIVAGMLTALTGQVDPNALVELTRNYINAVYDTLDKKVV